MATAKKKTEPKPDETDKVKIEPEPGPEVAAEALPPATVVKVDARGRRLRQ